VVIAHRLSTVVVGADRILLLDRGRVSAEGTHEGLLENSPLYKKLVETQMIEAENLPSGGKPQRI
jgi:ABC-type multidrug transport system fused ATPase/permease subunit